MTDIYEASIAALRRALLARQDRAERSLSILKDVSSGSEYAEDHRRLARIYAAVLRTFETEVSFENELKGRTNVRFPQ